jgi:hypothetical protein
MIGKRFYEATCTTSAGCKTSQESRDGIRTIRELTIVVTFRSDRLCQRAPEVIPGRLAARCPSLSRPALSIIRPTSRLSNIQFGAYHATRLQ